MHRLMHPLHVLSIPKDHGVRELALSLSHAGNAVSTLEVAPACAAASSNNRS